jgi:hypothetical protein
VIAAPKDRRQDNRAATLDTDEPVETLHAVILQLYCFTVKRYY